MSAPAANLFVLQDLEDSSRTANLAARDLSALRAVANWIEIFVAKPAKELGRAGPVCPFVPRALELKALWLAPQRIADPGAADLVQLIDCYKRLLLSAKPIDGDDAHYKAIIVVFTDLSADRAADYLGDSRIQDLKRLSYAEDGVVMGEFHPRNEGSAIRNPSFHPLRLRRNRRRVAS